MITLIGIKFLIGGKVTLNEDIEGLDPDAVGTIIGINAINPNDLDQGVEYTVKFGDWVFSELLEDEISKIRRDL